MDKKRSRKSETYEWENHVEGSTAAAYVFACNDTTQPECLRRKLFGSSKSDFENMQATISSDTVTEM